MKPLLASICPDIKALTYPLVVSPKLDGVRAIIQDGLLLSRSLKMIPNNDLQGHLGSTDLNGLDGELINGTPASLDVYCGTVSNVMSMNKGAVETYLWVFDDFTEPNKPFAQRYTDASKRVSELQSVGYRVCMVPHYLCETPEEVTRLEEVFLANGYEGLMTRSIKGKYKFGRSTVREEILLKVKRFVDSEAEVIDTAELMHNENEQGVNELGYSHRSQVSSGLVGGGVLGALYVKDCKSGVYFSIGSGFTYEQRAELWKIRHQLKGKLVKYKYFPSGSKDKPRFPTFLGFRSKLDM